MLRFYDQNKNRLVYLGEAASSEFWDEQRSILLTTKQKVESKRNPYYHWQNEEIPASRQSRLGRRLWPRRVHLFVGKIWFFNYMR